MSKRKNEVAESLAKLALMIAKEAMETHDVVDGEVGGEPRPSVTFDQRLEAFKALTTYHVNITKAKAKGTIPPDDEEEPETFGGITSNIRRVK